MFLFLPELVNDVTAKNQPGTSVAKENISPNVKLPVTPLETLNAMDLPLVKQPFPKPKNLTVVKEEPMETIGWYLPFSHYLFIYYHYYYRVIV